MEHLRRLSCFLLLTAALASALSAARAEQLPWSQRAANVTIERWPHPVFVPPGAPATWTHDEASVLTALQAAWLDSTDPQYFDYIRDAVNPLVTPAGTLPGFKAGALPLNSFQLGQQLLLLYGVTQDKRYFQAATALYQRLATQPRNASGGFWQSGQTPNQMTPDGIDEAEPFYAEYALTYHHPEAFADITRQFVLIQEHTRDPKTGLLHQDWDESKQERWANKLTGISPEAWGRGMGWYMAALVDTLPFYPEGDPGRAKLIAILNSAAAAAARYQDPRTGLWYQVLDKAGAPGNFPEASASCLFVYALAKGVREGYLPPHYLDSAQRGYKAILSRFVRTAPDGSISLTGTVEATDLGGHPYHDGSYAYYTSEKTVVNDPKGLATFIIAGTEMENAQNAKIGRGDTVMIDAWFNSQKRTDPTGREVYFHYKWDDLSSSGYSLFGHIWRSFGAHLATLYAEPTLANLRPAQVYIVASPDNVDKNPHPHFARSQDAAQIADWVKAGGVLMIMENDTSFADLDHFNLVAEKFGIHFNSVLRKHVIGTDSAIGKIAIPGDGPVFHHPHTAFVKDVCTISVQSPAVPALTDGGDILMATARYGKGTVFAFVDPWLYNEYTDGQNLPALYDNYAAGQELVRWVLQQVPRRAAGQEEP